MLRPSEHHAEHQSEVDKENPKLSELRGFIAKRARSEESLLTLLAQPGLHDLKPLTDLWLEQQLSQAEADRLFRLLIDRAAGLSKDLLEP